MYLTDNLVTHMPLRTSHGEQKVTKASKNSLDIGQLKLQLERQGEEADMEIRMLKLQLEQQDAMAETEIRKLRLKLAKQEETMKCLESQLELDTRTTLARVPPILLLCPAKFLQDEGKWSSGPFYSRIGDRKLQVEFEFVNYMIGYVKVWCNLQDEQFCNLQVTIVLSNHLDGSQDIVFTKNEHRYTFILSDAKKRFVRSGYLYFCIADIQ